MSVTIHTSLGDLKVELFCEEAPRSCKNFLALAASGTYDGTSFHRLIPDFMVQGGDPTGSGKGGLNYQRSLQSSELNDKLKHDRRGILGFVSDIKRPTDAPEIELEQGIGSQFYITFSRQPHLNGQYTVFGRVIDGLDTLASIERVPVGKKNRPEIQISIITMTIHANPIAESF